MTGSIEVICGSMFSGKTEELLRRLRRAQIGKQKIQSFKPVIDNRYSDTHIQSHDANKLKSLAVNNASEILAKIEPDSRVIGIDEAQFFDEKLFDVIQTLAENGKRVIVAGLDMDSRGKPFGVMPQIMAVAEYVIKLSAICMQCGGRAFRTQRLSSENSDQVLVGTHDMYEARCRACHTADGAKKTPAKRSEQGPLTNDYFMDMPL